MIDDIKLQKSEVIILGHTTRSIIEWISNKVRTKKLSNNAQAFASVGFGLKNNNYY